MYKITGYLLHIKLSFCFCYRWKMPATSSFTSFGNNNFLMWGEINLSTPFFSPGSGKSDMHHASYHWAIFCQSLCWIIHLLSPVDVLIIAHLNVWVVSIWTIPNVWCLFWVYIYFQWFLTSWSLTSIELSTFSILMEIWVKWETWN